MSQQKNQARSIVIKEYCIVFKGHLVSNSSNKIQIILIWFDLLFNEIFIMQINVWIEVWL